MARRQQPGIPKMSLPVFGTATRKKTTANGKSTDWADTGQTQPGRPETRTGGQADTHWHKGKPARKKHRKLSPQRFPWTVLGSGPSLFARSLGLRPDSKNSCSLVATIQRSQRTSVFLFAPLALSFFPSRDSILSPSWGDSGVATIHHPS